ncbi:cytochrome P450 [Streptomyces sp. NRRL S-813]|uniref:cytochrome P450 n=1 Tax=Streptomyces sp. NRRL S-813 TaxID=1463919 RepID=UPI00068F067F|nr:cytochrome P450 [Streptomyces sp. NRRL S-813]
MTTAPNAVPLYGPEHAADPQRSYELLRAQGPVGRAEIDPGVVVWVVTDYRAALDLLQDPGTWTKDTRGWDTTVPEDSPVKQPLQWRPSLFFADGEEHAHLRKVITDSFALLDPQYLRDVTRRHADTLLDEFARTGRADLVAQYTRRLPLMVLNTLFGMPDEGADQLMSAIEAMMSTAPQAKEAGEQALTAYLGDLYAMKSARRGRDLTSWFIDHPHGLSPEEVINQVMITQGAAYGTLAGLIANTLAQILSDQRYRGTLTTGSLPIRHAIDEVLWADPPLAMYSLHRARHFVTFHGRSIKAGEPVMVSYAAVNTCPHTGQVTDGQRSDYKAHLAFAAGPHACPAEDIVFVVSVAAIERLMGRLPDVELTVPAATLTYQPGPIYRELTSLPCRFTPQTPDSWRKMPGSVPVSA